MPASNASMSRVRSVIPTTEYYCLVVGSRVEDVGTPGRPLIRCAFAIRRRSPESQGIATIISDTLDTKPCQRSAAGGQEPKIE